MKTKLLGAALLTIAGFAVADFARGAAATFATYLASNAVQRSTPVTASASAIPLPGRAHVHRAALVTVEN
jgi:hypothetical protein